MLYLEGFPDMDSIGGRRPRQERSIHLAKTAR
jgi:hypothetical protein